MQMTMVDGTVIDLMPESVPDKHIVVSCSGKTAFQKIWAKLTEANLAEVTVTEDGRTVQTVAGMRLTGTQTHKLPDGTMIGHFYMADGVSQYFVVLDEGDELPELGETETETTEETTTGPDAEPDTE